MLLTVEDVAELLTLGVRSVWRHSATGELPPPIKIGKASRWDVEQIRAFIDKKVGEAKRPG